MGFEDVKSATRMNTVYFPGPLEKLRSERPFIRSYPKARRTLALGSPASGDLVTVAVVQALDAAGIIILGALLEVTGPDLQEAAEMGECLEWESRRNMDYAAAPDQVALEGQTSPGR